MRFLITAGPTREYLDPVRFLTNASTGKMGYACAAAAVRRRHQVTLVSGPVELNTPKGVRLIKVVSAAEMEKAVRANFFRCDCLIMTAAVCDFRPRRRASHKINKSQAGRELKLESTNDILAGVGRDKRHQVLIGFALQDRAGRQKAKQKLKAKKLDAIVLNSPAALGSDEAEIQILQHGGSWQNIPARRKAVLGSTIVKLAETIAQETAT